MPPNPTCDICGSEPYRLELPIPPDELYRCSSCANSINGESDEVRRLVEALVARIKKLEVSLEAQAADLSSGIDSLEEQVNRLKREVL